MPTIDVSFKDLCKLVGKKISIEDLKNEYILYAKGEVEGVDGDLVKIDIKDSNRPDLWSAEGIAREIQGRITSKSSLPNYSIDKSKVEVNITNKTKGVRPYTVCAVAKGLKVDENVLSQLIQLQEKVCNTFGRNRKEVAIGVYDLEKIKPPITYTTVKPDSIKFVPLESDREMTPEEILKEHPKGKEFAHLLEGCKEYPIFIDSDKNVLSMPPIINSDYTGKVTKNTRDLFIECSGFDFKFLIPALNVIVAALADRGAKIKSVKVTYPEKAYNNKKSFLTPDMSQKKFSVDIKEVNRISGLDLSVKDVKTLLKQARYDVKINGKRIDLLYPAYRQDIMNQRDVIEDIIISYGYNNIEPVAPKLKTSGSISPKEELEKIVSEILVGLGMQEILSYTLTSKENLFEKMNVPPESVAELENPMSSNWSVLRNWILPGLLEFLSGNQHIEYPQRVFEIGDVVLIDNSKETKTRDVQKVSCAIADSIIRYSDISSILDSFMNRMGVEYEIKETEHPSFINGRVGKILVNGKSIGVIGEIQPFVLENWKLEMPVAAFEINMNAL
jgi:phenylalanyl-tRNA synthetase beta chain